MTAAPTDRAKGALAMNTTHHDPHRPESTTSGGATTGGGAMCRPVKVALLMIAAIGVFYLLREHWDHVAGNWIYLLLLACPLMHLFHGHGGHRGHGARPDQRLDQEH